MPMIICVYGASWVTQRFQRPAVKIGVGFAVGTILMLSMSWALELVVLVGVFAIDLISDDFLGYLKERKENRIHGQARTA